MSNLTNKRKKELAKIMYMANDKTQQEISELVGISKVSISKWVTTEKWDTERASLTITREKQIMCLYQQIAALNEDIASRDKKIPSSKDADIIGKIASAISKLENDSSIADVMSVGKKIVNFTQKYDPAKAKELVNIFDHYIKENI